VPASLEDFQLGVRDPIVYRLADLDRCLRVVPADAQKGGAAKFACPADHTGLPDGKPPSVLGWRCAAAVAGSAEDRRNESLVDEAASFPEQVHLLVCLNARVPRRQEGAPWHTHQSQTFDRISCRRCSFEERDASEHDRGSGRRIAR
jgi:hypothetical protein